MKDSVERLSKNKLKNVLCSHSDLLIYLNYFGVFLHFCLDISSVIFLGMA